MTRTYKAKSPGRVQISEETILSAIETVKSGECSIRQAAKRIGVHHTTILNRMKESESEGVVHLQV